MSDDAQKPSRRNYGGCLYMLVLLSGFVPAVVTNVHFGDTVWRWAASSWPGGAYCFGAVLGLAVPGVFLLALVCGVSPAKSHRAQGFAGRAAALVCFYAATAMLGLGMATWSGGSGWRGRQAGVGATSHHTWASSHYSALWITGLGATLLSCAVIALLVHISGRRARNRPRSVTVMR